MATLALIGDYNPDFEPHRFTEAAVGHAAAALGAAVGSRWIATADLDRELLGRAADYSGFWVAPGSPYKDMGAVLRAIRFARENGVPLLGTCGGFQHLILEFARNAAGIEDAAHAETDPEASRIVVMKLACSLVGQTLPIRVAPGSRAHAAYRRDRAVERYYCQFGLNPAYEPALWRAGLAATGRDDEGEVRIVELPGHPFYVGTLFVPQAISTPDGPHPLVTAFAGAAAMQRGTRAAASAGDSPPANLS